MELRTATMNGFTLLQTKTTMKQCLEWGYFDDEAYAGDWTGRAARNPEGEVYVYHWNGVLIGWVDGEPASFDTLCDWMDCTPAELADAAKRPDPYAATLDADGMAYREGT